MRRSRQAISASDLLPQFRSCRMFDFLKLPVTGSTATTVLTKFVFQELTQLMSGAFRHSLPVASNIPDCRQNFKKSSGANRKKQDMSSGSRKKPHRLKRFDQMVAITQQVIGLARLSIVGTILLAGGLIALLSFASRSFPITVKLPPPSATVSRGGQPQSKTYSTSSQRKVFYHRKLPYSYRRRRRCRCKHN